MMRMEYILIIQLCTVIIVFGGTIHLQNKTTVWPSAALTITSDINATRKYNVFQLPIDINLARRNSGTGDDYFWLMTYRSVDLNNTWAQLYLYYNGVTLKFSANIYDNGSLTDNVTYSIPNTSGVPDPRMYTVQFNNKNDGDLVVSTLNLKVFDNEGNAVIDLSETLYGLDYDWTLSIQQYAASSYDSRDMSMIMKRVQYYYHETEPLIYLGLIDRGMYGITMQEFTLGENV